MGQVVFPDDVRVNGNLSAGSFSPPADSIGDNAVQTPSGTDPGIQVSKLEHRFHAVYADESATTTASEARVIHVARRAGTIEEFGAGSVVAAVGGATVTVDLLVNGSSVLTSTFVLDNANSAYDFETGTINTPTLAAGDVVEASWVAAAGGGTIPLGFYVEARIKENAS